MSHFFSEKLRARAETIGQDVIDRGEMVYEVPFGQAKGCIFVSRDPNLVNWTETVDVGGVIFHIGTKKEN